MHNTLLSLIRRFSIAALFIAVGSAGTINAQLVNINSVDCSVGGSVAFSGGKILITATGPCISAVVSTPGISSFSPTSAQVGQPVTITGTNFASNATVTVGGFFAAIVGTPTTTSLTFTVPNSVTAGPRNVVVSVSGTPSAGVSFTVDPAPAPTITALNPPSTTVGNSVIISGTNFAVGATVTVNGAAATVTGATTANSITIIVPNTTPAAYPAMVSVVVTVGGVASNNGTLTLNAPPQPSITGFSPTTPTPGAPVGASVTLTGSNFAIGAIVTVGGTNATVTGTPTATSLTFLIPSVSPATLNVQVSVGGVLSGLVGYNVTATSNPAPAISACTAASPGTAMTLTGTNFLSSPSVTIAGTTATIVGTPTASSIVITVPSAVALGSQPVVVTVGGVQSNTFNCTVSNGGPSPLILVDKDNQNIPIPSKFPNVVGPLHGGENGANGRFAQQNAWLILGTGRCPNANPAIKKFWYHNMDSTYYGSAVNEYFGVLVDEALVYSIIAPANGTIGGISFNESGAASQVGSYISISATPCDFDQSKLGFTGGFCYSTRSGINSLPFLSSNTPSPGTCTIIPGQRYYINYRNQDVVNAPNIDSCASQPAGTYCGGLFYLR